jgi:hypothetical protein
VWGPGSHKSPSAIDIEANRLRPRIVNNIEREALYEDVLKQKLTVNAVKDENVRLRTRLHMLETELIKKEKLIDELILKPDQVVAGGSITSGVVSSSHQVVGGAFSKMKKLESHLTQNLKRRIKEMQG